MELAPFSSQREEVGISQGKEESPISVPPLFIIINKWTKFLRSEHVFSYFKPCHFRNNIVILTLLCSSVHWFYCYLTDHCSSKMLCGHNILKAITQVVFTFCSLLLVLSQCRTWGREGEYFRYYRPYTQAKKIISVNRYSWNPQGKHTALVFELESH